MQLIHQFLVIDSMKMCHEGNWIEPINDTSLYFHNDIQTPILTIIA